MGNLYTSTTFMEHNSHPDYKYEMDAPTHEHDGINPSCGDELTLQLRVENGVIEEASFTGHGCAISQASADIMADLITGETVEEAHRLAELFLAMIRGEKLSEEDLEDLDEAAQLQDISHMPARVKCAELAWRTLDGMLEGQRTKSARPAPRLSFTTRPDANTGVFHSTKGLRQGPGPAKQCAKPRSAELRLASRLPQTGPIGCDVHFCEYSARQAVCIRIGSVNQHLQWPLYCVLEQASWSQGRKHELRERIGRHK